MLTEALPLRHWTIIIGREIRTISPITPGHAILALSVMVNRDKEWFKAENRTVTEAVDHICQAGEKIEAKERVKYDKAIVRAKLPYRVSGEVYIRGWQHIREYDHRRGSIEGWLWGGFVPRIYHEDKRRPPGFSIHQYEATIELEDQSAVDPIEAAMADEEFEDIFDHIRHEHLAGIDWAMGTREDLRLIDLWREALLTRWAKLSPKHQEALTEVHCDGVDRKTVAKKYFKNRSGFDQLTKRFSDGVRTLAARLRAEFIEAQ